QTEDRKVCTFAEGYIAAALGAAMGVRYEVVETECMYQGGGCCKFEIRETGEHPLKFEWYVPESLSTDPLKMSPEAINPRVDMIKIRDTVFGLPLEGNEQGLIPAFNVYLAHMPREFYNAVSGLFVKQMEAQGLGDTGYAMLEEDAEVCSLTTFSGIMASDEWAALVQPMIKHTEDNIFGLVAIINALGWGSVRLIEHTASDTLNVQTANAYEIYTPADLRMRDSDTHCPMMSGVMAGLMELVYLDIPYEDRRGLYQTKETDCTANGHDFCDFHTRKALAIGVKVAA
ncbi:MAG: 4-vinyl reductase, partial [Bdellovibrionales bacterium]|nr:4-vinyl reductase [Bdellovibrionales bacterium]